MERLKNEFYIQYFYRLKTMIFTTTVTIEDANNSALDLSNYTAAATLRKSYKSSSSTSFTVAFVDPRTSGQITLSLTDVQTGGL